ncbi:helix-turn-helix domain-containing protein, partial [Klebsiella pneumoniae]
CVAREGHGEVSRHGIVVQIPQIEYRLLSALLSPPHVVHDKRTLIAHLWPDRPDQDDTNLMQVVSRLRRKLIPLGLHRHIVTVPRM